MVKDHGPQIKDDERYEALRRQGASKEKAAWIANTRRSEAASAAAGRPVTRTGTSVIFTSAPRRSASRGAPR
jgi:hypothetical protein